MCGQREHSPRSEAVAQCWKTIRPAISKAGGNLVVSDKVIAVVGDAPQRVGVTEFPSMEKAQAWIDSAERKALTAQRDKAIKFTQQYIIEAQ
jgi:uncharacterized protein (DUF1330 family)